MKKIYLINGVPYGSTSQVMLGVKNQASKENNQFYIVTGYSTHPNSLIVNDNYFCTGKYSKILHMLFSRITGMDGFFSILNTLKIIKSMKKNNVDLIHLHNLHGWYINIPMLFKFIKNNDIKVIWTLHDCWAFTGHCPHFDMIGCNKWRSKCHNCPQYKLYPQSLVDNSYFLYKCKKKWFTNVKDMVLVTPSKWLENMVGDSFLKEYPIYTINNGINLNVFKPIDSDLREKLDLENKFIILGVSFGWNEKKGLDIFIRLAKELNRDYKIILVGTDDEIDKKLPKNILSIHRTQNQYELAKIYTIADIFVNPTREEVLGLVNLESLACGTPVITFNTGGSPECIDSKTGIVVEKNNYLKIKQAIESSSKQMLFSSDDCIRRAKEFDEQIVYKKYVDIYHKILNK